MFSCAQGRESTSLSQDIVCIVPNDPACCSTHQPHLQISLCQTPSNMTKRLRETIKTILLEQDPPYHEKDGGLFLYPPSVTSKDGALVV